MMSSEIRSRFLAFFKKRGHAIVPSTRLVPENDPSVLFNTAGMQPLVPYLMGTPHPLGKRLASCQKCVRTGDLEDIGDNRHFSFFEMLGNWSLGDYFKREAITWSYEFLTNSTTLDLGDAGLGLDPARLAVTLFAGDENAPYDQESKEIWMSLGISEDRIYALPADDNWWSPGDNGPCGPCSEMFYDMEGAFVGKQISHEQFVQLVREEKFIEIWNDVFMEYEKKDGVVVGKLAQKNVDTGAGLERITAVMQQQSTAYHTDLFIPVMDLIQRMAISWSPIMERSARIIADHVRTAVFLIGDGVLPAGKDRGYVLRRLIRRAVLRAYTLKLAEGTLSEIARMIINHYRTEYPELVDQEETIVATLVQEGSKFKKTLEQGLKEFEKGTDAFTLATTYGFPIELTQELAREHGNYVLDILKFNEAMREHQERSRAGSEQKFKGGLANTSEKTVRLHTAHHLLLAALQEIVSKDIHQRGSNITEERLRMDFSCDRKVTPEELKSVEALVNQWISEGLPVVRREMPRSEAEALGAEMEFGAKYPDIVTVYTIQNSDDAYVSKEFCGGPHVTNTRDIGHFTIQKEEASSAGVRRIKAVITP